MELIEERGNSVEELDPRMKLLLLAVFTTFTFLSFDEHILLYNYGLILILFFLSKLYSKGIKVFIYITVLILIGILGNFIQNQQFREVFIVVIQLLQRLSGFLVMAIWMASTIRVGDFVTSMERMHMPKGITITMAVTFRYLPTAKQEFHYIKKTMKLRGIGFTAKNIILHPIKTAEYSVVPMVIRCMTIADELAASAMTRGLDLETKRISYHEVKIKMSDILITFAFIAAIACGSVFGVWIKGGLF